MEERERIIVVIIAVILYNIVDQYVLKFNQGLTFWRVVISMAIGGGLYLALIYFFGKKHLN